MASRYWVGGTANWDATAGSKWATTSGGTGGASVPGSLDDVFFDANSGSGTCTVTGTRASKALSTTGYSGTINGSGSLNPNGSLTIDAGTTWSLSGTITLSGNSGGTITTNGKTLASVTISSGAGTWDLADALTMSGTLTLSASSATFNTNNHNITTSGNISCTGTFTLNLGSSTVTQSAGSCTITTSNLNAGTSTLKFTGSVNFNPGGCTFNNIWLASGAFAGTHIIATNGFTCNDFKDDGTAAHTIQFNAGSSYTVATFTVSGGGAGSRISLRSSAAGSLVFLLKASGTVTRNYLDIKDSSASGGATWNPGANSIDSGNNFGWTFPGSGYSLTATAIAAGEPVLDAPVLGVPGGPTPESPPMGLPRGVGRPISAALLDEIEMSASGEVVLCFATVTHADLAGPIYVVSEDDGGASTKNGRVVNYRYGGTIFQGMPFQFQIITDDERPPRGRVSLVDVENKIGRVLIGLRSPPMVKLELLKLSDFSDAVDADNARNPVTTPVAEMTMDNLYLREVSHDGAVVAGTLTSYDLSSDPWPFVRSTKGRLPGLFVR